MGDLKSAEFRDGVKMEVFLSLDFEMAHLVKIEDSGVKGIVYIDKEPGNVMFVSAQFSFLPQHDETKGFNPQIHCNAPVSISFDFVSGGRLGQSDFESLSKRLGLFRINGCGIVTRQDLFEVRCPPLKEQSPLGEWKAGTTGGCGNLTSIIFDVVGPFLIAIEGKLFCLVMRDVTVLIGIEPGIEDSLICSELSIFASQDVLMLIL